ncbi:YjgN family protein [Rhodoferax saidenbachensis]|uniref:Uncharacterized membrane protein YjgN (DUF898 family) n=1 Tax=Rhodoferax saidenbachensis TaxID=1484693 RepID=A0ABU1ZLC0_9BURK|nr:YjgN family protein [Rhodoferax saidenbachensis]MDR7306350.1 uncharacterized membrane protein YjgN (DUF898 family) [Rhodoferax saidenbachensis]
MTQHNDPDAPDAIDALDAQDTLVAAPPSTNLLRLRFTGSGSEYFRIWIVNLLLTIVTLTLYLPWARARKLRYFMSNTLVDDQPLGFHGKPLKMFKGYLLVCVLFALYSVAGKFSAMAGFVALIVVALMWPALFKSSIQFRLANTSWRGLRFSFRGSLAGAYRAMLPIFIPGLVLMGARAVGVDEVSNSQSYLLVAGIVGLSALLVAPWLFWNIKQYQHNHYALGNLQTTFKASVGSFYVLALKIVGVVLLVTALPAVVVGALGFGMGYGGFHDDAGAAVLIIAFAVGWLFMVVAMVCIQPYATSRLQNLVWTQTGNVQLRFVSILSFKSLLWLTLKNTFLIVITLGLYWPFAMVALTRLRLEAVTVKTRIDPALLVADAQASNVEAVGDAAGDFFGLDVGL